MTTVLDAAYEWAAAGFSVLPIRPDGSKRPDVPGWEQWQRERADHDQIRAWFTGSRRGLGIVMGAVSGNAEMAELEGRAMPHIDGIADLAKASGLGDVWTRVVNGYTEQSPNGGIHLIYRVTGASVPGNVKLARDENGLVMAETRGEGGQVVVAPTPGHCHETGQPWTVMLGSVASIPTITAEEREQLHALLRSIDETPPLLAGPTRQAVERDGLSPGDDYEERTDWAQILTPHGWELVHTAGRTRYWRRPEKTIGVSATTGHAADRDRLYVFTTSTAFASEKPYTKFGAYALLAHAGDHAAAARDLRARGFGSPPAPVRTNVAPDPPPQVDGNLARVVDIDTRRDPETRRLDLMPASRIRPRRVKWLWDRRLAVGSISLLAGREGLGKSTLAYWVAARITRGELPGEHHGSPRSVLVCATEDSWEHTIVPRLMAAGADLERVYRVEVVSADDIHVGLSLPRDVHRVEKAAGDVDASMLLLDPLMSRIDGRLDTHRDSEVRQALEPLAALADRAGIVIFGLIHLNKGSSTDILTSVMGSRAFAAVARSVSAVVRDPDDEDGIRRLFGTPKNNLGPDNLPLQSFQVVSHPIDTDEGPTSTGRIDWLGEVDGSLDEAVRRAGEDPETRNATQEAVEWLQSFLGGMGGECDSKSVKDAAQRAGHAARTLHRARQQLKVKVAGVKGVTPYVTLWSLPNCAKPLGRWQSWHSGIDTGQSPESGTANCATLPTVPSPREDGTDAGVLL